MSPPPRGHRNALIFDCDGVLVDAEQSGHRQAFNEMWRRLGVPWQWTEERYRASLSIAGGRERLARLRDDPLFRATVDVPAEGPAWQAIIARWHELKTEIYLDLIRQGQVTPRPAVRELAAAAVEEGWSLGVASSGVRRSVDHVVAHVLGERLAAEAVVVSGEDVAVKKPAPDVYLHTAQALRVDPVRCLVVEDTAIGMRAALSAGMACVVTPTTCTVDEDFTGAAVVLSALAATLDNPLRVLANAQQLAIDAEFSLAHAEAVVRANVVNRSQGVVAVTGTGG